MKSLLTAIGLVLSISLCSQSSEGGDRICGDNFRSTPLYGLRYREALQQAGTVMVRYQDQLMNRLATDPPDWGDLRLLHDLLSANAKLFFDGERLEFDPARHPFRIGEAPVWPGVDQPAVGSTGVRELLYRLSRLLAGYDPAQHRQCLRELNDLLEAALLLKTETEVFAAGLPLSLAQHSLDYWYAYCPKWMPLFGKGHLVLQEKISKDRPADAPDGHCTCEAGRIALAAAAAAVQQINGSTPPDAPGIWAQGLPGGTAAASGNFINQVIHCACNWWPY